MAQEPNTMTGDPAAATEIRSQIEQTRAEMSDTIDAIQSRLNPSRFMTDAKVAVKDATIGRVKRLADPRSRPFETEDILNSVKNNPIPVALIGIAATALLGRSLMRRRHSDTVRRASSNGQSRTRRGLLIGTCAGVACWSAWRFQQPPVFQHPPLEV
jgi:Protein of unknown function (DUF3618)